MTRVLSLTKLYSGSPKFQQGLSFWTCVFVSALSDFSENPAKLVWLDSPISDNRLYLTGFFILPLHGLETNLAASLQTPQEA